MSLSWARRGQVEPLAALVAVAALGVALALYAGVFEAAVPAPESQVEDATLLRVDATLRTGAVVVPGAIETAAAATPRGYRLRVEVRTADRTWTAGPDPPDDSRAASRPVPVRVSPGTAVPGRIRVEVWPWPEG